ncbi:hypothetical protein FQN57_003434 [Myotisia sp. PD_48]|nr:hypothetical protein FQN57_003434 [Myotisia sp. PD_48]
MQTFHQFTRFPAELQIMIWKEAYFLEVPIPQILEGRINESYTASDLMRMSEPWGTPDEEREWILNRSENNQNPIEYHPRERKCNLSFPNAKSQTFAPTILRVCRASRDVALSLGGFSSVWLHFEDPAQDIWFNFASDIVVFPYLQAAEEYEWPSVSNKDHCARIQHLAVNWGFFHNQDKVCDESSSRQTWIEYVRSLYELFPYLTNLYIFIHAVRVDPRRGQHVTLSHFDEPDDLDELPITLKPIAANSNDQNICLPGCLCSNEPQTWAETLTEIETVFGSEWLSEAMDKTFPGANFPPRIHERIFLRKGHTLDTVITHKFSIYTRSDDGDCHLVIDKDLFLLSMD